MKLTKKLISLFLVCLMSCAFLFGCGKVDGTYKFVSLSVVEDGNSKTYQIGETYDHVKLEETSYILMFETVNDQNVAILRKVDEEGDVSVDVGYWYEGYKKEIYIEGISLFGSAICKKDGKNLTIEVNSYSKDIEYTFKK